MGRIINWILSVWRQPTAELSRKKVSYCIFLWIILVSRWDIFCKYKIEDLCKLYLHRIQGGSAVASLNSSWYILIFLMQYFQVILLTNNPPPKTTEITRRLFLKNRKVIISYTPPRHTSTSPYPRHWCWKLEVKSDLRTINYRCPLSI